MAKGKKISKSVENKTGVARLEQLYAERTTIDNEAETILQSVHEGNNPIEIIKAQKLLSSPSDEGKSQIFVPEQENTDINGYKRLNKNVTLDVLKTLGRVPTIFGVLQTRIDRVTNFSEFQTDFAKEGWTIQKKLNRFENTTDISYSAEEKKEIDRIATIVENCGVEKDNFNLHSNFTKWLSITTRDTLTLDQACSEIVRTKGGDFHSIRNIDGATVRLLETIDPNYDNKNTYVPKTYKGYKYLPIYGQVWRQNILENPKTGTPIVWYPHELMFGVRNSSSDIWSSGYGLSELEILIQIVTYILYGTEYNGNFFKKGSNPKGFFSIGKEDDPRALQRFRMMWQQTMRGVHRSHQIPIFGGGDVKWTPMGDTNKDMEFQKWNEFLTLLVCMVYRIAPEELGLHYQNSGQMFGGSDKEKLKNSEQKGLKPLLKHEQSWINKWWVSQINPEYKFVWTGIDIEDTDAQLDRDIKLSAAGFVSQQSMFLKYEGEEFKKEVHTLLNPVWTAQLQQQMYGGGEGEGDQYNEDEVFDVDNTKDVEENPFTPEQIDMEKALGGEQNMNTLKQAWVSLVKSDNN